MALKTVIIGGAQPDVAFSTSTVFSPLGGKIGNTGTESVCQGQTPFAATAKNLGVNCTANTITAATSGFLFRVNGASVNQTVLMKSAGTGWISDSSHSDSLNIADDYNIEFNSGGGEAGSCTVDPLGCEFDTTGAVYQAGDFAGNGLSGSFVLVPPHGGDPGDTESQQQLYVEAAGTLANLTVNTQSASSATVVSRIGGSNGTQTVSPSGTGITTDSSHSDSITATNLVNSKTTGSSGNWTVISYSMTPGVNATADIQGIFYSSASSTTTYYVSFASGGGIVDTTESFAQAAIPYACTGSFLRFYNFSTTGSTITCTMRIGGSSGAQTFVIGSGTSPVWTVDSSHSDSISAGELIDMQAVNGSGSSTQFIYAAETLTTPSDTTTANLTGVAASGVASALSPKVSVTPGAAAATGVAIAIGPAHLAFGVHALGAAGFVKSSLSIPLASASASGAVAGVTASDAIAGAAAAGGVAAVTPEVFVGLAPAIAEPAAAPITFGQQIPYPLFTLMRDSAVACFGSMSDAPIALIGRMPPSGPQPIGVEVRLAAVSATAFAGTVTPFFNVYVHLASVSADGDAAPVVAA